MFFLVFGFWFLVLLFLFLRWDGISGSSYKDDSGNGGFTVRFGRRVLIFARLSTDGYPIEITLSGIGWETMAG